jgi:N-acetylmuramoyl-L-alanine amidase
VRNPPPLPRPVLFATLSLAALFLVLPTVCIRLRNRHDASKPKPPPSGPLVGALVVLDPGHGRQDSGAVRGGLREDALNYRLAAHVARELRRRGATVWTTVSSRTFDAKLDSPLLIPRDARLNFNNEPLKLRRLYSANDLWRRAVLARKAVKVSGKQVFFLSLHADSLDSRSWWGARVYRDVRDKKECVFAQELLKRLTRAGLTYKKDSKIVHRDYGVLNPEYNTATQKALLEAFTISSKHDRIRARSPVWRQKVAVIVADSVQATALK